MDMNLETLYQRALNFEHLTKEEGMFLFENAPLNELSHIANELRKKQVPHGKVTWQIDRNLNTTNVCIANCKFCNFYRIPGHAEALDCDVARLGSAGAKTMAVVLGEVDIYVHAGGMYQWDSAAPIAVAAAAGLFTSRIDGTPLIYNRRDAWLPDLVVCQQHLAQQVIDALRAGRLGA